MMQRIQPTGGEYQNGASINGNNGVNGHYSPAPPAYPVPQVAEEGGKPDFHGIFSAFRRRWFLALGLGLLFGVPAAIGVWTVTPAPYIAFAELWLRSSHTLPGSKDSFVPDFNLWKQTVQRRATHPEVITAVLRDEKVRNTQLLREQVPHEDSWLEQNLEVGYQGTEYLRIQLEGENAEELATIVKVVSESLRDNINEEMLTGWRTQEKALNSQASKVRQTISENVTALNKLREDVKIDPKLIARQQVYLIQEGDRLRAELRELRNREKQLRLELELKGQAGAEQSIEEYKNVLVDPQVPQHPDYQDANRKVFDLELSIEDQKAYIEKQIAVFSSETHPSIVNANKKLKALQTAKESAEQTLAEVKEKVKKELLDSIPEIAEANVDPQLRIQKYREYFESESKRVEEEYKKLQEENARQQKKLDEYAIDAARITATIEKEQAELDKLEDMIDRLNFDITNYPERISISRPAEVPPVRSMKKKTMFAGVSGFGLFGFFVAGVVFLEYRTQRIANLNQVSEKLNLRVMGTVPLIPGSVAKANSAKKQAKNAIWYSALTEAVDSTRTLLIRGSRLEPLKTIMITSAMGGEGKTTMSSHLATSLARGGRKILLVDCDLRRPCVHRAFDLPNNLGVCEIFREEAKIEDCIQELDSPAGLSILPAGKLNQQALKSLAMDSLDELLEPLKDQYDFILIDSSPLLPVTDALLVAQHVDGVILSIRRDVSRVGKVVMACQKLSMLGIPLLGAVTIGLQEESAYRSKYGYNYYSYGQRPVN